MKFSVLICSLEERKDKLEMLMNILKSQILNYELNDVEILVDVDNREKSIGQKRNDLLERATGEYIAFIDDDDIVPKSYLYEILEAIKTKPDVVGMNLIMTTNGYNPEISHHSIECNGWWERQDPNNPGKREFFRTPNHLNPVKREIALKAKFPEKNHGEDKDYSERIRPFLNTEVMIEEPLYYYQFNPGK